MWKRSLFIGLGTVLLVFLLAGLVWYLAFFAGPSAPKTLMIEGVQEPMSVEWTEDGPVEIEAASQHDAIIGLGYGMGRSRAWQLLLWREAARGNLSPIFGADAAEIDRLTRQLQLGDLAKREVKLLPEETAEYLGLLTSGLNAALSAKDVARHPTLLLLGVDVEPWEVWHSLAVERLFAWIAWNPFSPTDTSAAARANRNLREILQVDGFEYNTISSTLGDSSSFIAARYTTGRISIPFFIETKISIPDRLFLGLFVPGTFIAPLGHTSAPTSGQSDLSWAFLLRGKALLAEERIPSNEIETAHSRIELDDREELVVISRFRRSMPLIHSAREAAAGPVKLLHWQGLFGLSDQPAWISLLQGKMADISLIRQDGVANQNGMQLTMGSPEVQISAENGLKFIASAGSINTPEDRVSSLQNQIGVYDLLADTYNESAARAIPQYLRHLPDSILSEGSVKQGVAYLMNWNFEYDSSEIGASIFELMRRSEVAADSTLLLQVPLILADMELKYGLDKSGWRWENIQERTLYYPGTSSRIADNGRPEESFLAKYHPIDVGGPGHPQTFVWGSAYINKTLNHSSAWEGALDLDQRELLFRRPFIDYSTFLGAFLSSDRPIELNRFSDQLLKHATRILPANSLK